MTETDEKVLCVGRVSVDLILSGPGDPDWNLKALLNQKTYRNRHTPNGNDPDVEHDDRYKQLIPYIVCVNSKGQILAYNRGSKGGEKRLKGRWAIGFGGHVNDADSRWMDGVGREIVEELKLSRFWLDYPLHGPIGFLNDDSDDVGRHHLGVVYILRADEVVPRENPEFTWKSVDHLAMAMWQSQMESWARLALPMVREYMESEGE